MEFSLADGTVYIKQKQRELYYLHPHQWVATKTTATGFSNTLEATTLCFEIGLRKVELFWDFGDPADDLYLPVR